MDVGYGAEGEARGLCAPRRLCTGPWGHRVALPGRPCRRVPSGDDGRPGTGACLAGLGPGHVAWTQNRSSLLPPSNSAFSAAYSLKVPLLSAPGREKLLGQALPSSPPVEGAVTTPGATLSSPPSLPWPGAGYWTGWMPVVILSDFGWWTPLPARFLCRLDGRLRSQHPPPPTQPTVLGKGGEPPLF